MSTAIGSHNALVLHTRMEGKRSTTKINYTDVCFPTLDWTWLRVNLVIKSDKMPSIVNIYLSNAKDRKE